MSDKGCSWDNAVVESFFSTLKLELGLDNNREVLMPPQQLQRDMAFWIEGRFNRQHRHAKINYISTIDQDQWSCPCNQPCELLIGFHKTGGIPQPREAYIPYCCGVLNRLTGS